MGLTKLCKLMNKHMTWLQLQPEAFVVLVVVCLFLFCFVFLPHVHFTSKNINEHKKVITLLYLTVWRYKIDITYKLIHTKLVHSLGSHCWLFYTYSLDVGWISFMGTKLFNFPVGIYLSLNLDLMTYCKHVRKVHRFKEPIIIWIWNRDESESCVHFLLHKNWL